MEKVAAAISPGASIPEVHHLLRTDPERTLPTAEDLKAFAAARLEELEEERPPPPNGAEDRTAEEGG